MTAYYRVMTSRRSFKRTAIAVVLLAGVSAAVLAAGRRPVALRPGEFDVDGRIYGMPPAEIFTDDLFYEGNPLNDWRGMQTVSLGASNGAVVEFIAPEEGDYVLVDHEFADAQKGAVGHITVRSRTGETTRRITTMNH